MVSEAYLQQLQAFASARADNVPSFGVAATATNAGNNSGIRGLPTSNDQNTARSSTDNREQRAPTLTLKHATAESFVSGLKRFSTQDDTSSPETSSHNHPPSQLGSHADKSAEVPNYDYVSLKFDTSSQNVTIQLPPFLYATQLVSQFETFMGYEYHWYLRQDFHTRLEETYRCPASANSRRHTWLSKVLAVFALGESFNSYEPPLIDLSQASDDVMLCNIRIKDARRSYLPGVRFFEQALSLFKMPSEEPEIEHVEALNLITAYMYAGMSARIASSLMLHIPATTEPPAVSEHRKRVWWTTFLMDAMVSSEMGLRAAFGFAQAEHAYPSDAQVPLTQQGNFWDSNIMTAHIKLCNIRISILETVGQLHETDFAGYERVIAGPLLELEAWKRELSPDISFDFQDGVPQAMLERPSMRPLASCYLRYHQGYIMLIRPVFFKLLSIVLGREADMSPINGLLDLSSRCLEVAKCNLRIITTLSNLNRLAKYGFYESLHLFSSIKIFSLSRLVNAIRPGSLIQESQDVFLYSMARDLLLGMAESGNLASRGHRQMLDDIERQLDIISRGPEEEESRNQDVQELNFSLEGIHPWIDSIGGLDSFLDLSGFPEMTDNFREGDQVAERHGYA